MNEDFTVFLHMMPVYHEQSTEDEAYNDQDMIVLFVDTIHNIWTSEQINWNLIMRDEKYPESKNNSNAKSMAQSSVSQDINNGETCKHKLMLNPLWAPPTYF